VTKKRKRILTWILVWAGMLIVVLYSPVGSPDLYSSQNYLVYYRPVAFKSEITAHAPKQSSVTEKIDDGLIIPDVNSGLTSKHSIASYRQATTSLNGLSYEINETSSYKKYNSGSGRSGEGDFSMITGRGSHNSAGTSEVVITNGMATLSLTSGENNSIIRQSAKSDTPLLGGTDPGGDPTYPAIPVGDGQGILILLAWCYTIFKKRVFIKKQFLTFQPERKNRIK